MSSGLSMCVTGGTHAVSSEYAADADAIVVAESAAACKTQSSLTVSTTVGKIISGVSTTVALMIVE